jgi:DNA-directed RNA polymerase specialized sigma24 family protein
MEALGDTRYHVAVAAASGLNREALGCLLQRLSTEPERAGEEYVRLRAKLIHYFVFERCTQAEDLADEVLDRVARRLNEGEEVQKVTSYALGVARLVTHEARQRSRSADQKLEEYSRIPVWRTATDDDAPMACLERCLEGLAREQRDFILAYYGGGPGMRIAERKKLAARLGLGAGALRNRALRLRLSLEECLERCLGRGAGRDENVPSLTTQERQVLRNRPEHEA